MADVKYPEVKVKLIGKSGNALVLVGYVANALRAAGHRDVVKEFQREALKGDYDNVLQTCMRWVEVE